MKLPYPHRLPETLRRVGRAVLPAPLRHRVAADLQHIVHMQARSDPEFRRSVAWLKRRRDSHRGQTCVILGNGPSMADQDLSVFKNVTTFGLNRGYLRWLQGGLVPSYFVAVNDLVIEQFHHEIADLPCPLLLPWEHHRLFPGTENAVFLEMRWHNRFFSDVSHGVWPGGTVTFATMQIAYHMGFQTVILVGVDHRYTAKGLPHAEVVQTNDDVNHFTKDYFGPGVRWNLPDLEQSERAYRMARDAYTRAGRHIIDATKGGELRVFEKMPLEKALAQFA